MTDSHYLNDKNDLSIKFPDLNFEDLQWRVSTDSINFSSTIQIKFISLIQVSLLRYLLNNSLSIFNFH